MPTVSVIIPTLNAAAELPAQLARLQAQTLPPHEVIVADSASTDDTVALALRVPGVRVIPIARADFDHGGTRDLALAQTTGEFICFLTQDSFPMDENYLQRLVEPFADAQVGCVCGRQVAKPDASLAERLTRAYNYPDVSFTRNRDDLPRLGVKTFFLSDACSAYRRTAYAAVGGFARRVLTNEDMLIATRMIAAGYRIAYQAEARVLHSHRFRLRDELRRNFDIGAFLKMHEAALLGARAEPEGLRYVATLTRQMLRGGHVAAWVRFLASCGAKWIGNRLGRRYATLSHARVLRLTGNRAFWNRLWKDEPPVQPNRDPVER